MIHEDGARIMLQSGEKNWKFEEIFLGKAVLVFQ
jgi:hypothetical protein